MHRTRRSWRPRGPTLVGRLTWLADEFRKAGLKVSEVAGWKTRGSESFSPVGVTWHATAGSRNSTAQGEVNVILNGSSSAPPPIAQLMIYRDGTIYVCAAGRCNHNKVGWAGPNKGLGNTALLGIEMANDNKGEPWPTAQLDAARKATAIIMRKLGADPMKRLAGHYEHQPYSGRPPGEKSTKTDPSGVNMAAERQRVKALMSGAGVSEEEDMSDVMRLLVEGTRGPGRADTAGGGVPVARIYREFYEIKNVLRAIAAEVGTDVTVDIDEAEIAKEMLKGLRDSPVANVAELLRGIYDEDELAQLKAAL
jgi:hypothetical protein